MRNFDAFAGAATYVLLSALMTFEALEPVSVDRGAETPAIFALASCFDGPGNPALAGESIHL